ncbi:MAG: LysR family transcriptional regulator [Gemmatimonadaceae bacterium]|nr:LysR family transcriptional regulator [Acetobacteraceae bacterium]
MQLNDLAAFVVVADEMSFTRAARKLGMSPSALSHAMKALETRLDLRLLARTTRSVRPTEVGDRLLRTLRPALQDIGAELTALGGLRQTPSGTLRITTPRHAATSLLWPVLPGFLDANPDVSVEVTVDEGLTDIVAGRYDAGIRFGDNLAPGMVAVRIGPPVRPVVVASPGYFAAHPPPQSPDDLAAHRCINYRLKTSERLWPWEFEVDGRPLTIRVEGRVVFNDGDLILTAALAGQGVAYLFEDQVAGHVAAGRLERALAAWCPVFPGYSLYHPSRRQTPLALAALIQALRAPRPL